MHRRDKEMVARKMKATDFGSEMPPKGGETIASVLSTGSGTPTNLVTFPTGQI